MSCVRRALREIVSEDGGTLRDLSVSKLGRTFWVAVYYSPNTALSGQQVDDLTRRMEHKATQALPGARVMVLVSELGRQFLDNPADTETAAKS